MSHVWLPSLETTGRGNTAPRDDVMVVVVVMGKRGGKAGEVVVKVFCSNNCLYLNPSLFIARCVQECTECKCKGFVYEREKKIGEYIERC